jgi:hypothetical protein
MLAWALVIGLNINGDVYESIPYSFTTEQECWKAAEKYTAMMDEQGDFAICSHMYLRENIGE